MRFITIATIALLSGLLITLPGCNSQTKGTESTDRIIGVKIYEHREDFEELIRQWKELGINTVFCSIELYSDSSFRKLIRDNDLASFIIFPVFYDPEALAANPGLYAITERGTPASDDWVTFVCPSRMGYRKQKIDSLVNLVHSLDPDGISLDFIRHFVFWEKVYPGTHPDSLLNTCFDPSCVTAFQKAYGLTIPDSLHTIEEMAQWVGSNCMTEWLEWKCGLITSMVSELSEAARKTKPEIKINIHLVPWRMEDFSGAIRSIAGQDFTGIAPLVDYLSPMTYAHMVKQDPPWIHSVVMDIDEQTEGRVVPSIQVREAYLEERLTVEEFEESLSKALEPPSCGVVFWSWEQLEKEPEKREVVFQLVKKGKR